MIVLKLLDKDSCLKTNYTVKPVDGDNGATSVAILQFRIRPFKKRCMTHHFYGE